MDFFKKVLSCFLCVLMLCSIFNLLFTTQVKADVIRYEAEDANHSDMALLKDIEGYSGEGYYNLTNQNDFIEFTVTVSESGYYPVILGFSGRYGSKPINLYISGTSKGSYSLPATEAISEQFKLGNFYFEAGNTMIKITPNWTWCCVDYLEIGDKLDPPAPKVTENGELLYEAEDFDTSGNITKENSQEGFSGEGYLVPKDGSAYVEFMINCEQEGFYPLKLGAAGIYGSKNARVYVNGSYLSDPFISDGKVFIDIDCGIIILNKGLNTIKVEGNWSWYALDYIIIGKQNTIIRPLSTGLTNPYASYSAQELMKYFSETYGNKLISGQTAGNLLEFEYIHSYTGKLPAIKGLEMYDGDNAVNDAIAWAKQGGIVAMQWHWWAPKGGRAFYTSGTSFDPALAVTPGTEEYDLIIRDIDQTAAYLKKLADANVPVLWRPLHEAEGSGALDGSGAWFWWGRKGPDVTKALYEIIYDRLTNYHKLNNLIWVWTSGVRSTSPQWYPGNDIVDIVGMDNYPSAGDHNTFIKDFKFLVDMTDGEKMVVLSENGSIPDSKLLSDSKTNWGYFVTWSGEFVMNNNYNSLDFLNQLYNDDYVITLDKLPSKRIYGIDPLPIPSPLPLSEWEAKPFPEGYTVYQAEDGILVDCKVLTSSKRYSGAGYVGDLNNETSSLTINITAPEAGEYDIIIRASAPFGYKENFLYINGIQANNIVHEYTNTFVDINIGKFLLNEGINTLKIVPSWGYALYDCVFVKKMDSELYGMYISNSITKYFVLGDIDNSVYSQLSNSFKQAIKFAEKGDYQKAIKHMEDFLKHINNKAKEKSITKEAKENLIDLAEKLIIEWNKM